MAQAFDGKERPLIWGNSWHGHINNPAAGSYTFASGAKQLNTVKFWQAPMNHPAGDITISYWSDGAWIPVANPSAPGFGAGVSWGQEKTITFDTIETEKLHFSLAAHPESTSPDIVGVSEIEIWSLCDSGPSICASCPQGKYSSVAGHDCQTCAVGQVASADQTGCEFCPAGKQYEAEALLKFIKGTTNGAYTAVTCGTSTNANAFGSKQQMETAGWAFDWVDNYAFIEATRPDHASLCANVPAASYCGFKNPVGAVHEGSISLQLSGSGTTTIDFGNSYDGGPVKLYLNDQVIDTAPALTPSKTKEFAFEVRFSPGVAVMVNSLPRAEWRCLKAD